MRFRVDEEKFKSPYSMKDMTKFYLDQMILENRYTVYGKGPNKIQEYDLANGHAALDYEFPTETDYEIYLDDLMNFKFTHDIEYLAKYMSDEDAMELYNLYRDAPIPELKSL